MSIDLRSLLHPNQLTSAFIMSCFDSNDIDRVNAAFGYAITTATEAALASIVHFHTLSLRQWKAADFPHEFTHLAPLRIEIDRDQFRDCDLQQLLTIDTEGEIRSRFPNASSLRFSAGSFYGLPISLSFLQYCPLLKSLRLDPILVDPEEALECFSHVPHLEELSLNNSLLERLATIVSKLPHLKRLNMRCGFGSLEPLATTHLEQLDISEGLWDKATFRFLPQTLKVLIARDSVGVFSINDADLETIVQSAPHLEELEFTSCVLSLGPIARLAQLRRLNISCHWYSRKQLMTLCPLQNLRSLIFPDWLEHLSSAQEICALFPNLSNLQLNTKQYKEDEIQRFREEWYESGQRAEAESKKLRLS